MQTNLAACANFSFDEEGGYTNDARDSGNWYHGVLVGSNLGLVGNDVEDYFYPQPVTAQLMRSLTRVQALPIYAAKYWQAMGADGLAAGFDLLVVDFGYNGGIHTSARLLQQALNLPAAEQDGWVGPITQAASRVNDPAPWLTKLVDAQKAYYRTLKQFPLYGDGWLARADRRLTLALHLATQGTTHAIN